MLSFLLLSWDEINSLEYKPSRYSRGRGEGVAILLHFYHCDLKQTVTHNRPERNHEDPANECEVKSLGLAFVNL